LADLVTAHPPAFQMDRMPIRIDLNHLTTFRCFT
jgi:hypothetical protein